MLGTALLLLAAGLPASGAHGYVYWGNYGVDGAGKTIGRASLGGLAVRQSFIPGAGSPKGVAVGGGFIYWSNYARGTIGRARTDGTQINQAFVSGAFGPQGVAVDESYVYWANQGGNAIGRARLNGAEVNQSFIPATADPYGVAVDGTYIYWSSGAGGSIGRAGKADGAGAAHGFISPAGFYPDGVAVNATHIYWTNYSGNSVARAKLSGEDVRPSLIPNVPGPSGIALDGSHIYWSNFDAGTIGIATLSGTGVNHAFIQGATKPWGLAIDALGPPGAPVLDTTAPTRKLSGARRQDVDRLAVRVTCGEDAVVHLAAKVKVWRGNRVRTMSLRPVTASLVAGTPRTLRLRLSSSRLRAVKRSIARGNTLRVKVQAVAVDGANNRSSAARRTIRLKG